MLPLTRVAIVVVAIHAMPWIRTGRGSPEGLRRHEAVERDRGQIIHHQHESFDSGTLYDRTATHKQSSALMTRLALRHQGWIVASAPGFFPAAPRSEIF